MSEAQVELDNGRAAEERDYPGPCDRGPCAANRGHAGTCDEASGWAEEEIVPRWAADRGLAPGRGLRSAVTSIAEAVARWKSRKRVGVTTVRKGPAPRPAIERIHLRPGTDGHWLWSGAKDELIRDGDHRRSVRRLVWEDFYGEPLDASVRLIRECGKDRCMYPRHMKKVDK